MERSSSIPGYVYVLVSPFSKHVKLGGTTISPMKRIREINAVEPYKSQGPWTLHDFRQVSDWRTAERHLHDLFRSKLVLSIPGQKEFFSISPREVSNQLNELDP
ncbi:MAG: GIY-YIG nuclease family protein, partial [Clostridiales bacterium]|nr:GIY-YIG nuclease family protein [Clostridiales bacterium]